MEFRINYWDVFISVVGFNLLVILGVQFSHLERHGSIPNKAIPYVLVVVNVLSFFGALADPPLRFIKIDKGNKLVTYTHIFHSPETVEYERIQSEWTTRRTGRWSNYTMNVLLFKLDGNKIFSLSEASSGWSKEQLNCIHELINNKS